MTKEKARLLLECLVGAFAQAARVALACFCALNDCSGHYVPKRIVTLRQIKVAAYVLEGGRHHGYIFELE
jgi:hypothetical protein